MTTKVVDGIDRDAWLSHFMPRAEAGDPRAQIQVGWQYATGVFLEKDLDRALHWFREAEKSVDELAVFNIIRMFAIADDPRAEAVFHERKVWSLGAIYVAYANHRWRMDGHARAAIPLFQAGGEKGSLAGWAMYRKLKYPGLIHRLLFLPYELPKLIRLAWIQVGDREDIRVVGYWT